MAQAARVCLTESRHPSSCGLTVDGGHSGRIPATFNVRLSTTPDTVDGDVLVTILKNASGAFELASSLGPIFALPPAPAIIKITAANDDAEASCRIRSKTITLRAT